MTKPNKTMVIYRGKRKDAKFLERLLRGEEPELISCPAGQPGIPLFYLSEQIDNDFRNDKRLSETLGKVGLGLKDILIIVKNRVNTPMDIAPTGSIYPLEPNPDWKPK